MDIDDHPAGAMEFGSHGNADGDFGLSSSAPNGDGPNRNSRCVHSRRQHVCSQRSQRAALCTPRARGERRLLVACVPPPS